MQAGTSEHLVLDRNAPRVRVCDQVLTVILVEPNVLGPVHVLLGAIPARWAELEEVYNFGNSANFQSIFFLHLRVECPCSKSIRCQASKLSTEVAINCPGLNTSYSSSAMNS